jgi:hypothetical protein
MKKLIAISLTTALCSSLMAMNNKPNHTGVKKEGIKYIKMLGMSLKSELKSKMKEDKSGLGAIGFCSSQAEQITKDVNAKLPEYASVRRTANRLRNPNNKADDIDKKVMQEYELAIANKTFSPKNIKVFDINGTTRVYKPLVMKKVCLKCHGTNVSDDIKKVLASKYPNDKALGYKEGDFRGVIVSEIKKH